MTFEHGKGTVLKLDNSAGALQDLSAYLNNVDFGRDVDVPESTTFGDDDREYIPGLRNGTLSFAGFWDSALDAIIEPLLGEAAGSFEYGPQGSSSGAVKYTGEALVTNYSMGSPVDGIATFSLDLQISGAITRTSWT